MQLGNPTTIQSMLEEWRATEKEVSQEQTPIEPEKSKTT